MFFDLEYRIRYYHYPPRSQNAENRDSHDRERASQSRLARDDRLELSLDMEHLKMYQNMNK